MKPRGLLRYAWPLLAAALLVGCPSGPTTGTLAVFVSGLPVGIDASIRIHGGTVDQTVTGTRTLQLAAGSYSVEVMPAFGNEAIARTVYDGISASSSVSVANGTTTDLEVDYERRPGTNRAWLGHSNGVRAFDAGEWSATGTVSPVTALALPDGSATAQDIVIAPNGDLYAGTYSGSRLLRYAADVLDTAGAQPTGTVDVTGNPVGLVWHEGRLYVMTYVTQQILRFDTPQAIVGTSVTSPDATISVTGFTGTGASAGLAFDSQGRLWAAFAGALVRIDDPTAPVGIVSVSADAALTQSVTENRLVLTYRDGSLFTAHCGATAIQRYDAVDVASGVQAVPPTAVISVGLSCVTSIGFDASGRFWLSSSNSSAGRYADLGEVGDGSTVAPIVTIDHGTFIDGGSLTFNDIAGP